MPVRFDTNLTRLAASLLDLLLPLSCTVCSIQGRMLCSDCEARFPRLMGPFCSKCSAPGSRDPCEWCATSPPALDGVRAPYLFDGAVRDIVYRLKYQNMRALAPDVGRLLFRYLETNPIPGDALVPVPLHGRRKRERGYNQSQLLAAELSKATGLPMEARAIRRTRNTAPQVSMSSHEERIHNIEGAFQPASELPGRRVILVDDVVTTGNTMFACAVALRAAGAVSIWGLVLARQP